MSTRILRGWFVVAACFSCMLVAGGIGWFTFPVFLKPLENDFGWTRTQLMIGIGIWAAITGISSPFLGYIIDRWKAKYIMLAGVAVMGLATLALAEMRSLAHLYILLLFVLRRQRRYLGKLILCSLSIVSSFLLLLAFSFLSAWFQL